MKLGLSKYNHLKIILSVLYILLQFTGKGQGLNYELGFNDNYNQISKGVVCVDEYSYFVKQQYNANSFFTTCSLYKLDTLGNEIWEVLVSPGFAEVTDVHSIIPSETGGVYVLGHCMPGCDLGNNCFWFLQKYDGIGNGLWTKYFNDSLCFESEMSELNLSPSNQLIVNYSDANVSKIYSINFDGTNIDSLIVSQKNLDNVNSSTFFEFIASKDDSLFAYDNSGTMVTSLNFASNVMDFGQINDTLFILTQDSIFSYTDSFGFLNGTNIASNTNLSQLKLKLYEIQFISSNSTNQNIITLDHQLQVQGIISIPVDVEYAEPKDFNDLHFVVSQNFPLTDFLTVRYLDYSLQSVESETINWTDISVVDFNVTQLNASATTVQNIYQISLEGEVLIKNFGNQTLNQCRINHFIGWGIACGTYFYTVEFSNLNLLPGDSIWIDLGLMHSEMNYFIGDTLIKQICLYTSHPNTQTDLLVPNDEYCEDVILGYASLIEIPLTEKKLIKVVDLLGRETEIKPNVLLIYIFSDGSTEKVLISE